MPENRFEQLFATTLIHLTGLRFGKGTDPDSTLE
jgi:hypothetical protein